MEIQTFLIELGECKNCWWRDFFLIMIEGDKQRHFFLCYENYDQIYGIYRYHQFYFN